MQISKIINFISYNKVNKLFLYLITFPSMIFVAEGDGAECSPAVTDGLLLAGILLSKLGKVGAAGIARPRSLIA